MNFVEVRRRHIVWAILQNPTEILIQRTQRVDKGGYFEEETREVGPFVVRIYQTTRHAPVTVDTLGGAKQLDRGWGLLADENADIQAGANVKDEFNVEGIGRFQVVAVYPQVVQGVVVGYQADLEKVG
ncbi:MAG: hypothetical protein A6D91_04695 [Bacillaceae bacterium G1]|nr:MAG: hypothetical protein A6D91_04695 [Bacillaceae bacterium G1]